MNCVHEISRASSNNGGGAGELLAVDILTHHCNSIGNEILYFDPFANAYIAADDLIVTDNEGNVVTK